MNKKFLKTLALLLFFVLIQAYVTNNKDFNIVLSKWTGYFTPVIWAVFISVLLDPIVDFIQKKIKVKKIFAIILSFFLVFFVLILLILMIVPQLINSVKELNNIYPYIIDRVNILSEKLIYFLEKRNIWNVDMNEFQNNVAYFFKDNVNHIKNIVTSILTNIVLLTINLTNIILGVILAFLLLLDKATHLNTMKNILKIFFKPKSAKYIEEKILQTKEVFLAYITGKLIVSFIVGVSVFVVLLLTNTPYASLSAILLGLGNMIPYVGSIIGGIISAFFIFLVAPVKVLFLILAIAISQLLDGFIVGPKIIGDKVGLNSFWVMVSMMVFGGLFGIMGMFLGIPIMCVIKIIYRDMLENKKEEEKI